MTKVKDSDRQINLRRGLAPDQQGRRYRRLRERGGAGDLRRLSAVQQEATEAIICELDASRLDYLKILRKGGKYYGKLPSHEREDLIYEFDCESFLMFFQARNRLVLDGGFNSLEDALPKAPALNQTELIRGDSVLSATSALRSRFSRNELAPAMASHLQKWVTANPEGRSSLLFNAHQRELVELSRVIARLGKNNLETLKVYIGSLVTMLMLAPFWIRPVSTWVDSHDKIEDSLRSLLDHLFVLYPVPRFLYCNWVPSDEHHCSGESDLPMMKWVVWFVLMGQGASLHRAGPFFDPLPEPTWRVATLLTAHLYEVPESLDYEPEDACSYAEVVRLGGSLTEWVRLGYWRVDPTKYEGSEDLAFFRETVIWLVQRRDALTDVTAVAILPWARHLHTEGLRPGGNPFSWKGRSPARSYRAAFEYHVSLEREHQGKRAAQVATPTWKGCNAAN